MSAIMDEIIISEERRPAWLDIECPGCGNVWYCQSDHLLECDDCGARVWIPLTYTGSFIEESETMPKHALTFTPSEVRALRALVGMAPNYKDGGPGTIWPALGTLWGKLNREDLRPTEQEGLQEEAYFAGDIHGWLEVQR